MSYRSLQDYLRTQRARYQRTGREEKGRILTEGCALFGMHRKSLIRAFARARKPSGRRRGPKPVYGPELLGPLKGIWLAAYQPQFRQFRDTIQGQVRIALT